MGAFATVSSAEKVRIESCVKRIDEREQQTRKKAETLLGNIGQFIGMSATTEDIAKIAEPGQQLIKSAFELTAYAPPELNVISLRMAFVIHQGLVAKTTEQKIDAIQAAKSSLDGWSANYSRLLDGFEKSRMDCLTQ
ncbi:hypothetical protein VC34_22815 [Pseudomonas fluorescens]|uniref:Uncharacterized protein n=2 Tax=Pseudomonas fluorescens TaxID=294 RepID=A0A0F4T3C1_PSEFL|nr:hypothetical protein VC34_22815 [Pseudomonas fluorescens]